MKKFYKISSYNINMDELLNKFKSCYSIGKNNKINKVSLFDEINSFISDNQSEILENFLNEIILMVCKGLNYELLLTDKDLLSSVIERISMKNIKFNITPIFNPLFDKSKEYHQKGFSKNTDINFFTDIKTYHSRALILDIISDYYNLNTEYLNIFNKIPSHYITTSIFNLDTFNIDIIHLLHLKSLSKFLYTTFPHIGDININTYIPINNQIIFSDLIKYYSNSSNLSNNYSTIKNIIEKQLSLFINCGIKFNTEDFNILLNKNSNILIPNHSSIKKSNLISSSIFKSYIIDTLFKYGLTQITIFNGFSCIKAQLYGDKFGQLKYFSKALTNKFKNSNDELNNTTSWEIMYEDLNAKIKWIYFDNGDKNIKNILSNLTYWHTEYFLNIISNPKLSLDNYVKYFLINPEINNLYHQYDDSIPLNITIDNNILIKDNSYIYMKTLDNNDFKSYIKILKESNLFNDVYREYIVDFLVNIFSKFKAEYTSLNTLYLSVLIFDSYISKKYIDIIDQTNISNLKLIAYTSIVLASKYEDDHPITMSVFPKFIKNINSYVSNSIFIKHTNEKLKEFEYDIISVFNYSFYIPTILYFANYYMDNINLIINDDQYRLIYYILELSLQYTEFLNFTFNLITVCAIYFIIKDNDLTIRYLLNLSGVIIDNPDFIQCMDLFREKLSIDILNVDYHNIRNNYFVEYNILKSNESN